MSLTCITCPFTYLTRIYQPNTLPQDHLRALYDRSQSDQLDREARIQMVRVRVKARIRVRARPGGAHSYG